jgi:hypothetical protein
LYRSNAAGVEFVASTTNPEGRWVTQQARNLMMQLDDGERRFKYLIRDRDSKFSFDFDTVIRSEGIRIIRTRSAPRTRTPTSYAHSRHVPFCRNDTVRDVPVALAQRLDSDRS